MTHRITITCEVEAEPGTMPPTDTIIAKLRGLLMLRPGLLGRGTRVLRETLAVTTEVRNGDVNAR